MSPIKFIASSPISLIDTRPPYIPFSAAVEFSYFWILFSILKFPTPYFIGAFGLTHIAADDGID